MHHHPGGSRQGALLRPRSEATADADRALPKRMGAAAVRPSAALYPACPRPSPLTGKRARSTQRCVCTAHAQRQLQLKLPFGSGDQLWPRAAGWCGAGAHRQGGPRKGTGDRVSLAPASGAGPARSTLSAARPLGRGATLACTGSGAGNGAGRARNGAATARALGWGEGRGGAVGAAAPAALRLAGCRRPYARHKYTPNLATSR
jgi:hypothetical protein